ncbi:hypothetical protein EYR40_001317 [Pleurotus pulmonarius]|nr:hypothetical protein EYR40_001317 [Pleurotus pulmonarius]
MPSLQDPGPPVCHTMADSRPSDQAETAPLLRDPDVEEQNGGYNPTQPTFNERMAVIAQEPLTPLTKILLILVLALLLLSSVFIGLFAGVQHKLNVERGRDGGGGGGGGGGTATAVPTTITTTATATETETYIGTSKARVTTTATTTAIETSITTTTVIQPTTVLPAPVPVPSEPPSEGACLTPECIMLSASILASLDTSQDPCENFYDYANGGWLAAHPLPADKGSFGNFEALAQQNKQLIQQILEGDRTPAYKTPAFMHAPSYDEQLLKKLRGLYASCTDEKALNEIGVEPLWQVAHTVRKLFSGKSTEISAKDAEDDAETARKGLTSALAFLHSRGIDALFSFDVEGDVGVDPNFMTLWFSQPGLGLPSKEYYEEESITEIYQGVIEDLLTTLAEEDEAVRSRSQGLALNEDAVSVWPPWPWPPWEGDDDDDDKPSNKTRSPHKLAKKVLAFETELAKASLDLDILFQDPIATYNPTPLANLTSSLPQVNFKDYFATFTPRSFPSNVIITYPSYPASLSKILDDTPSDIVEAYLITRAALELSPYLGMETKAWQAQRRLYELLSGVKKGAVGDRAEYCTGIVESTLGFAAGRYFANETFGGESREKGTKVITDIIDSFKTSLQDIDWMDKKSAKAASEKADAIRVKVGFPLSPDTRDPASLARYYALVTIDKDKFFSNILSASVSDESKKWAKLGRTRDLDAWEMYASTVNAYFNPPANEIVFPAGILQPPFFSQDWPAYLSYGSFGHVAAHELTHAFDSAGRLYNQNGKLEEWWTNSTSKGFQTKQDCIVKQYSEYSIDDGKGGKVYVNGNLTSGENIGDTGLIQAYRAWQAQYPKSLKAGNEYLLPGLNFTREQLFFISFARIWARVMKPAAAVQRIRTDPHSPSRYRVDGTVFNIPEFAKAFNCSPKSKLNPPREKQCIFWG